MSDRLPAAADKSRSRPTGELIEQAIAEIEALRFRLWSELEEDDPSLYYGVPLETAYRNLDRAAEDLRWALAGPPEQRAAR